MGASLMNSTISLDDIYPVGSIYMNINSTNPTNLFGGIWKQIKEQFILGCGDTHTAGSTGGKFTHTLTVYEMPAHNHIQGGQTSDGNTNRVVNYTKRSGNYGAWLQYNYSTEHDGTYIRTYNAGNSQPMDITPPYLAVYIWQRTA